jgi:UDP-glucose 4-epimerase
VVVHCAALIEVGQSVQDPAAFYDVNVRGSLALIAACRAAGVRGVVLSSTCATYGVPQTPQLEETHPQLPLNPYGWTKLMVERALWDHQSAYGLAAICLRYFNAAGAAPDLGLGERHDPETHAIPLALASARGLRGPFNLFGADYPTRDGTCVRDYIHVLDLAEAHVRAVERLAAGGTGGAFNLGTGTGTTVLELLTAIEQLTGQPVPLVRADRRPGDSPALVADARLAAATLGWRPQRTLADIITSAWDWHTKVEPTLFAAVPRG